MEYQIFEKVTKILENWRLRDSRLKFHIDTEGVYLYSRGLPIKTAFMLLEECESDCIALETFIHLHIPT